jgi:hypothetical protein
MPSSGRPARTSPENPPPILPKAGHPSASVSGLRLTSTGYTVTVRIGSRAERITVIGSSIWMATLS